MSHCRHCPYHRPPAGRPWLCAKCCHASMWCGVFVLLVQSSFVESRGTWHNDSQPSAMNLVARSNRSTMMIGSAKLAVLQDVARPVTQKHVTQKSTAFTHTTANAQSILISSYSANSPLSARRVTLSCFRRAILGRDSTAALINANAKWLSMSMTSRNGCLL